MTLVTACALSQYGWEALPPFLDCVVPLGLQVSDVMKMMAPVQPLLTLLQQPDCFHIQSLW